MTLTEPRFGAREPWGAPGVPGVLAALGLLAALAVPATPSPAAAQGAGANGDGAAEEPWLGVGLRQAVRCETRVETRPDGSVRQSGDSGCRRAYVAVAVVEDAPADRAGVQPGDTVVAVNGKALSRESGRVEVGALESGRPAQLLIGRPGEGRLSVRLVPEPRPPRVEPGRVRMAGGPAAPGAPSPVPPPSPGAEDEGGRAGGGAPAQQGEGAPVVFGRDEEGRVVVRWRDGDSTRSTRLREMTPRLEAIRDSVFAQARRHIRALREHQREALRRARERARVAADEGRDAQEEMADALLRTESLRAAGAEFRPLTTSLADYFPGADRGLLIMEVLSGTPAAELGLRPGDVVIEAGGREVAGPSDLREALEKYPDQDSLAVKWIRKGEVTTGVLRRQ
jgi:membrane-associated protease RseP (regulator of RpoE activity)